MSSTVFIRWGLLASALGPLFLYGYGWSEATFGPSQQMAPANPDGPLRVVLGIQLVIAALFCFAVALLALHARLNETRSHENSGGSQVAERLGFGAVGLFLLGSALWWPIGLLRLGPQIGLLAGAPTALGGLCLIVTWAIVVVQALRRSAVPAWARPLPLVLIALLALMLALMAQPDSWPVVELLFVPFALGWGALGFAARLPRRETAAAAE